MKRKLISTALLSSIFVFSITPSCPIFASNVIDTPQEENLEYQKFLEDDHIKDFDELVQEGAEIINEYDYIQNLKKINTYSLMSKGFSKSDISKIESFSDDDYAKELASLSSYELMERGLKYSEVIDLKNGNYNKEMLRAASSNIAFNAYKNWAHSTGTPSNGTFKAAMTLEYAFDNRSVGVITPRGSMIMAFAWGKDCQIVREQTTAKISYLPKQGTHEPGREKIVRLYDVNSNSPNHGGYFSYNYHLYNYGSVYPGKGKAYVVIRNSYQGHREIDACGSFGTSQNSPWSVSLAIGPASISYTGTDEQLGNRDFTLYN